MIILNPTDSRPLYEQITEKIKELIIGGYLKDNDKVPSVRELASQLAINPNTIQKAYKLLESDGYIFAKPAKGYFVRMPDKNTGRSELLLSQMSDIVHELRYLGVKRTELMSIIDNYYNNN